ncbi:MAG: SDR family oxidoreductase [Fibrobacterota bacterium]
MKRLLVTGGSSGLGLCLAGRFLSMGWEVHTLSRRAESAPGAVNHAVDHADARAIAAFTTRFIAEVGCLDLLINNAAIAPAALLVSFSEHDFDRTLMVDFTAPRLLSEQLRPLLRGGTIINVVSRVGKEGRAGLCAYAAAKGLLIDYTRSLSREMEKDNIRVVAVNPGFMVTPMVREKMIEVQRRESILNMVSAPEASTNFIAWIAGQSFGSGSLFDFDSRIYQSWN